MAHRGDQGPQTKCGGGDMDHASKGNYSELYNITGGYHAGENAAALPQRVMESPTKAERPEVKHHPHHFLCLFQVQI